MTTNKGDAQASNCAPKASTFVAITAAEAIDLMQGPRCMVTADALENIQNGKPVWNLSFPVPIEVVPNDDELCGFGDLIERFGQSNPETADLLKDAAKLLDAAVRSAPGLCDMDLAVAIAGGPEVACGYMLEHLSGRDWHEGKDAAEAPKKLVQALDGPIRDIFLRALPEVLEEHELAFFGSGAAV